MKCWALDLWTRQGKALTELSRCNVLNSLRVSMHALKQCDRTLRAEVGPNSLSESKDHTIRAKFPQIFRQG